MKHKFALIPARYGSKRIKNKNLKLLKGHPLIAYSIYYAKKLNIFDDIIVSTDSKEISDIAKKYGASVPFLRSTNYATDNSNDFEWMNELINSLDLNDNSLLVTLRPSNPIRNLHNLKMAIEKFENSSGFDSLRAMQKVKQHPAKMWRIDNLTGEAISLLNQGENLPQYHSRPTQLLEDVYCQDASLEVTTVKSIKSNKSISGNKVLGWINSGFEGYDLNSETDWIFLEFLIKEKLIDLPNVGEIIK